MRSLDQNIPKPIAMLVDTVLLCSEVQKEVPLRDLLSLHRSKSGSNFAGSNPTTPGSGVH